MRLGLLFLILVGAILPQTAVAQTQLKVDVDQASFAYDATSSLVEIYMAFEARTLPFRTADSVMVAQLPVIYQMRRSTTASPGDTPLDAVWADTSSISFVVADTSRLIECHHFLFQSRAARPPGEYDLGISSPPATDDNRPALEITREVIVTYFTAPEVISLTDITLASSIARSSDQSG